MKKLMIVLFGLLTFVSCSDDDDKTPDPATEQQLQNVTGHWYTEIPATGEIENWRTEEEGDMTTYDKIGAVIYLNGANPTGQASFWGYIYMNNDEMVNVDGLLITNKEPSTFSFTMDSEGLIVPSSNLSNAPVVSEMRYNAEKDVITANVSFKGKDYLLTFYRTDAMKNPVLYECFEILTEEGLIGGGASGGGSGGNDGASGGTQSTDVDNGNATEPSRVKHI